MLCAISDLHMGNGRASDRFGHTESAFLAFLDHLEDRYERIVLAGDVYETHHGARFGGFAAELALCRRVRPRIDERLRGERYLWIFGNHDHVLADQGVPDRIRLEVAGTRLVFVHGHQFDDAVQRMPWSSRWLSWSAAFLSRQGYDGGVAFLDWLDDRLGGLSGDPDRCRYQARARRLLAGEGGDVVVMGHTHLGTVSRRENGIYVNSGACLLGRFEYAHLDPVRGEYELRRWGGPRSRVSP